LLPSVIDRKKSINLRFIHLPVTAPVLAAFIPSAAHAGNADLAMKLANPIASLIRVPIQGNHGFGMTFLFTKN
jgi:hypothetical protein